jgi:hypothetical protein
MEKAVCNKFQYIYIKREGAQDNPKHETDNPKM